EDRDALDAELVLRVAGRDRDVVEEAEAHRPAGLGMVPGWPDEREAAEAGGLHRRAGGEQRGAPARLGEDRVAVEPAGRGVADQRHVVLGVAAREVALERGASFLVIGEALEQHAEPLLVL